MKTKLTHSKHQNQKNGLLLICDSVEAVDVSHLNKMANDEKELWLKHADSI